MIELIVYKLRRRPVQMISGRLNASDYCNPALNKSAKFTGAPETPKYFLQLGSWQSST